MTQSARGSAVNRVSDYSDYTTCQSMVGETVGVKGARLTLASPSATKALDPDRFPHLPRCHAV